jgi:hypothetical protein
MTLAKQPAKPHKATRQSKATKQTNKTRWSQHVTDTSDALTLEPGIFMRASAKGIAQSLKRSSDHSHKRKAGAYRSAISMLTFYINRAGRHLPARRRKVLETAKDELRSLYGKDQSEKTRKQAAA